MPSSRIFAVIVCVMMFSSLAYAHVVGTSQIHVPAVLSNENQGTLTTFNLTITTGTGNVIILGPTNVGNSTLQSAQTAAQYASSYLGLNESAYNFTYKISYAGTNVSGPSGGLAFTVLAIAAFENKPFVNNFTLTGTISQDGNVGPVGGIYDKANAGEMLGMKFIIVPYVQPSAGQTFYELLYYIINKTVGIPVVQVSNVSQALQYAFGEKAPIATQFKFPWQTEYPVQNLPYPNLTCTNCNSTNFDEVLAATLNATNSQVAAMPSSYFDVKQSMLASLSQYRNISNKGYLYTSADLSYLLYIDAFLLANHNNVNASSAYSTLQGISSYCNSLSPPQLTNTNYELVIGGEVRQTWANVTLNATFANYNSSGDSDGFLANVYSAAPALGWCIAAKYMYNTAATMNGTPVQTSQKFVSMAQSALQNAKATGNNQYSLSAMQDFNEGWYAASLYNSGYAEAFAIPISNVSVANMEGLAKVDIANSTFGMWPNQFASSAEFYLYQANATSNTTLKQGYAQSALTSARIAEEISLANEQIETSFVLASYPSVSASYQSTLASLEAQVAIVSMEVKFAIDVILFLAGVLIVMFIIMLYILLKNSTILTKFKSQTRKRHRKIRR